MRVNEVSMEQRRNGRAGEREIPEKTRRPAASSCIIPKYEHSGTIPLGIEHCLSWWKASALLPATPPRPRSGCMCAHEGAETTSIDSRDIDYPGQRSDWFYRQPQEIAGRRGREFTARIKQPEISSIKVIFKAPLTIGHGLVTREGWDASTPHPVRQTATWQSQQHHQLPPVDRREAVLPTENVYVPQRSYFPYAAKTITPRAGKEGKGWVQKTRSKNTEAADFLCRGLLSPLVVALGMVYRTCGSEYCVVLPRTAITAAPRRDTERNRPVTMHHVLRMSYDEPLKDVYYGWMGVAGSSNGIRGKPEEMVGEEQVRRAGEWREAKIGQIHYWPSFVANSLMLLELDRTRAHKLIVARQHPLKSISTLSPSPLPGTLRPPPTCLELCSTFEAEKHGSDKGYTATLIECAIASKRKAVNWRAVFSSHGVCTCGTFSGDPIMSLVESLKEGTMQGP
ncbi:hypothetical protein PR048_022668 [Dryococelus australis]|uniref:Uncharacterized protein n=1 Tax=Dryococelus australis TaxID=614101 RepID=A0ABQ9H1Q5_9NEOP|nr:hypothetical protein PR048_022668 [Dryococelus australis]